MAISYLYIALVFLAFSLILFALKASITDLSDQELTLLLDSKRCRPIKNLKKLLGSSRKSLIQVISLTKLLTLSIYFLCILIFFITNNIPFNIQAGLSHLTVPFVYFLIAAIIISIVTLEIFTFVGIIIPYCEKGALRSLSYLGTIPLFLFLPVTFPTLFASQKLSPKKTDKLTEKDLIKKQLLDIISHNEEKSLEPFKQRLIKSLAHFDDKTCREVMVPRMRIECLENTSSIFEALSLFIEEGFSRIPIYDKSIDHITGVLLYKDVLEYTFKRGMGNFETIKKAPITSLITPILYAPENKKISELFQVMRSRKIHATIVVNEYGCTEGLVTIEDIFEELIGSEILDEHDEEDELLYKKTHDKGWIVEADLSIIDAEREFGFSLPHDPEYETIGGFISTTLGVIPKPGSVIHFDQYEIKVLSSNERKILKVKISFQPEETPSQDLNP